MEKWWATNVAKQLQDPPGKKMQNLIVKEISNLLMRKLPVNFYIIRNIGVLLKFRLNAGIRFRFQPGYMQNHL